MKPRIYVTVPNGDGLLHKHVVFFLLEMIRDRRFEIRIEMPTHVPFENNLHHCVVSFLNGGEDFWLTVDADNPPFGSSPLDRVVDGLDVCGFPTPVYHNSLNGERPYYWNAYRRNIEEDGYNEWREKSGLQEVDAVGTGCVLFHRRVFEHPMMQEAPFLRKTDRLGRVIRGNDLAFCERARSCGFRIWADFDRPCRHFVKGIEMVELIQALQSLQEPVSK